jgi:TolB-like protein
MFVKIKYGNTQLNRVTFIIMFHRIQNRLKLLFAMALVLSIGFAQPKINLYLIKFDNIQDDKAVEWLRDGFPDLIREEFIKNNDIKLRNQSDLERVMNNRTLLRRASRRSRDILLLGKFDRIQDEVNIGLQLVDIANWEELDKRNFTGSHQDISSLSHRLVETVHTMLMPLLPIKKEVKKDSKVLTSSTSQYVTKEMPQRAYELTKSIDRGIDLLEESMDLVIGAKEIPSETDPDITGEWVLDLNVNNQEQENPENDINTRMLIQVLENLTTSPYKVRLSKPRFEYDTENDDQMNVVLPVTYSLKEHIIKDMLTSLPYSGLRQEGSFTVFMFDKEKFNFPADLRERLRTGAHRVIPVVRFFNDEGEIVVVIVDTPEAYWHSKTSKNVLFIPTHHFSPLIDFTVGGWSLQIAMETVNISVDYTFTMNLDKIHQLGKVSLKFIPETELGNYLKPFNLGSS